MWTLLIADDERTIREGIASSIDWSSLEISRVLLAADGKEAFDVIMSEKPHIAIMDIVMPEMTGIEVIARLQDSDTATEFVIVSGYSEFDYAQEAIRYNVRDYILKPCDTGEIKATVRRVIARIKQRESVEREQAYLRQRVDSLIKQAQEQVLRDYLSGDASSNSELFEQVLCKPCQGFKLLLFSVLDSDDLTRLPQLKRCVEQSRAIHGWRLVITVRDCVILAYDSSSDTDAKEVTAEVCKAAAQAGVNRVRAAVSPQGTAEDLPNLYKQAWEALKYCTPISAHSASPNQVPLIDVSTSTYSDPVRQVIHYVRDHLSDSSLSLSRIASDVFYLNPDYLGRIFKRECGVRFSEYLMAARMEKAKQIMERSRDLRIYEVAELVGLGDNPAYFGQVFRRYTGIRPSEYRSRLSQRRTPDPVSEPGD